MADYLLQEDNSKILQENLDGILLEQQPPTVALNTPADVATGVSLTPDLLFTGTDGNGDEIEYNVQVDTTTLFTGLLASWKLDENAGTSVADATGNGYTGTFNGTGTLWATGKINSGGNFVRANSNFVNVPNFSDPIVGVTTLSLNIWFNVNSITTTGGHGSTGLRNGDANDNFYILQLSDSSNVEFRFRNSAGTATTLQVDGLLVVGTFVMLTLTYDGTTLRAYVNGVEQASGAASGSFGNSSKAFRIGDDTTGNFTGGVIDEVGFWTKALSAAEVTTLYNSTNGRQLPLLNKLSVTPDATFTGTGDPHPWASGNQVTYTVQAGDILTTNTLYYWRARGTDPLGSNTYGDWSTTRSFTTTAGGITVKNLGLLGVG